MADVPIRSEQLIWSAIASNGKDYTATFVPQSSPTLYLLADTDNFLSVRKTLLYWWPITSQWLTDTQTLNILFLGTLELTTAGDRVRTYPLQDYTYFNVKGEYEKNWKVLTGDAARAEIDKYNRLYNDYFKADEAYQAATLAYQSAVRRLGAQVQELKGAGQGLLRAPFPDAEAQASGEARSPERLRGPAGGAAEGVHREPGPGTLRHTPQER